MKNLLLLFLFVLSMPVFAEAQSSFPGLRAGYNYSNVSGDGVGQTSGKSGFHAGVFYQYGLSEKFGFQPELLYSKKGYGSNYRLGTPDMSSMTILYTEHENDVSFSYVVVSLPMTYTTKGSYGLQFSVGPSVSYMIGARTNRKVTDHKGVTTEMESVGTDGMNTLQLGAGLGVGYLTKGAFGILLRLEQGISRIFEEENIEVRDTNLMLSLSWALSKE